MLQLTERTGWSEQTIREAYDEVMDYLVFDAPFGTGDLAWSEDWPSAFCGICSCNVVPAGLCPAGRRSRRVGFACAARPPLRAPVRPVPRARAWISVGCRHGRWFTLSLRFGRCDFNSMFTVFHQVFFLAKPTGYSTRAWMKSSSSCRKLSGQGPAHWSYCSPLAGFVWPHWSANCCIGKKKQALQ